MAMRAFPPSCIAVGVVLQHCIMAADDIKIKKMLSETKLEIEMWPRTETSSPREMASHTSMASFRGIASYRRMASYSGMAPH